MFGKLKNLSIQRKLLALPVFFLVGMLILQLCNSLIESSIRKNFILPGFGNQVLKSHKNALKSAVEIEATVLGERVKGLKTREEQMAAVVAETDPIRFFDDRSGYFFTYDFSGVRINVPINKAQNNKNLIASVDSKGNRFVEDLVNAAKNGGGFVSYYFEKEGQGIQPKLSYSMQIPGTDFLVGAGVYIDDVESEKAALQTSIKAKNREYSVYTIGIFILVLGLTMVGSFLAARSIGGSIKQVIVELLGSSQQIGAASAQVASASHDLAAGASEQAASLEETSASLEEMSSMARGNTDNAQKAKELSNLTRVSAETGDGNVKEMNGSMKAIQASSREMREAMDAAKASNAEVAKIIKTIDEIAFQTNILALNAAVEAARAGEAGMGFAVVADEVRNLAQKSAQAARETAEKIDGAIQRTEMGARVSEKVEGNLQTLATQCQQVGVSLQSILNHAREVDGLVGEIAAASSEQKQGIEQVNIAVSQMDKVTQSNAANAEESASAATELSAQADSLQEVVHTLVALSGATVETGAAAPRAAAHTQITVHPQPASGSAKTHATRKQSAHGPAQIGNSKANPGRPLLASRKTGETPGKADFQDF